MQSADHSCAICIALQCDLHVFHLQSASQGYANCRWLQCKLQSSVMQFAFHLSAICISKICNLQSQNLQFAFQNLQFAFQHLQFAFQHLQFAFWGRTSSPGQGVRQPATRRITLRADEVPKGCALARTFLGSLLSPCAIPAPFGTSSARTVPMPL